MKRKITILFGITLCLTGIQAQPITIKEAKAKTMGTQVTLTGIVTCDVIGNTSVRYFQDPTGGMAVYSAAFASAVTKGDSITITGTLKNYQDVIELDPVASFEVHSSGHPLPEPLVITPSQQHDSIQGMLVLVKNVVFEDAGKLFSSGTYNYTASNETGVIYVHPSCLLNGHPVPTSPSNMTGISSTYFANLQILVRDMDDFEATSSIWLTSPLQVDSITTDGFRLRWTTNIAGTTQLAYGLTPDLEKPALTGSGGTGEHSIKITGEDPAELIYVKAFSVTGADTAWSPLKLFITRSNSSGDMKVYFNRTVDNSVSSGTDAVQLFMAIDDTLVQYINRAKHSIDFTIYNYNTTDIADITTALNAAHAKGVEVRVVNDENMEDNAGWDNLNPAIGAITSPLENFDLGYNIMHNKFIVFDALSPDPEDAIVWTGSTNFTTGQINSDPNNVVIIHDQSLAKAYRLEFEEMFGSSGLQPDPEQSRFGPYKKDNTPHEFVIGGKRVQCYFSPSDGVNQVIENTIMSADHELYVNTMLITRDFLASAIMDRKNAGVDTKVIVNSEGQCIYTSGGTVITIVVDILKNLGPNFRENGEGAILHHKTVIVDQGYPEADPLVLTGSHNWSSSADTRNDENTLIIHDATIANIYYQEFNERFKNGKIIADVPVAKIDYASMKQGDTLRYNVLDNDEFTGGVDIWLAIGPFHGQATVAANGLVTYIPLPEFTGLDTMAYKICSQANDAYCDSASLIVYVEASTHLQKVAGSSGIRLYPNPNSGNFTLSSNTVERGVLIEVFDFRGHTVYAGRLDLQKGSNPVMLPDKLDPGMYVLRLEFRDRSEQLKLMIQ